MAKGKRVCAYCHQKGKLTKEHIWPAAIIARLSDRSYYSAKLSTLLFSDPVIRDVCGACNQGPLSLLDAYGCNLFDKYFCTYRNDSAPVLFEYDFHKLARWLLKLSFNSARVMRSDHERLSKYATSIRDHGIPLPNDFSIAVDLVLPSRVPGIERSMYPASNRLCAVKATDGTADWCTIRLVAINSYYFWILVQDVPDNEVNPEHAQAILSTIRGTRLNPQEHSVLLEPSGETMLDAHADFGDVLRARDAANPVGIHNVGTPPGSFIQNLSPL